MPASAATTAAILGVVSTSVRAANQALRRTPGASTAHAKITTYSVSLCGTGQLRQRVQILPSGATNGHRQPEPENTGAWPGTPTRHSHLIHRLFFSRRLAMPQTAHYLVSPSRDTHQMLGHNEKLDTTRTHRASPFHRVFQVFRSNVLHGPGLTRVMATLHRSTIRASRSDSEQIQLSTTICSR